MELVVHDLTGIVRSLAERNLRGAPGVEGFRQVAYETFPCLRTTSRWGHHGIHTLQADVTQNKWHHGGGQGKSARQSAGGHAAAVVHLRQDFCQHLITDGIYRACPDLFFQRTGFSEFVTAENAVCTELAQVIVGAFTTGNRRDLIAQLVQ